MNGTFSRAAPRILLIRAGALGDCLLMLPVLTALRAHFPRACIEVMGYPPRWAWVLERGLVDAVQSIERPGMHFLFCRGAQVPAALAAFIRGFDIILSYRPDPDGLFADNLRALGAGCVLSQPPFPPPPPPRVHIADFALQLVAQLGVHPPVNCPWLPLLPADVALVEPFFSGHHVDLATERLLVLHPGSGSEAKRWPLDNFVAVLDMLSSRPRLRPVIVVGYAEEGLIDTLLPQVAHLKPLIAAQWPLLPTAALLAHATVFVGHDSGLSHLAAAFGRPTVAIFGPTDPLIWGPRGKAVTIVQVEMERMHSPVPLGRDDAASAASHQVLQVVAAVEHWLALDDARRSPNDRSV